MPVVRVNGPLEASPQDIIRKTMALPVPGRLRLGELLDGMTVTACVADNGVNLLYAAGT